MTIPTVTERILKYTLESEPQLEQKISLPKGAFIMGFRWQSQIGKFVLWVSVDMSQTEMEDRTFMLLFTGDVYVSDSPEYYMFHHGTDFEMSTGLVYHLFERRLSDLKRKNDYAPV